MAAQIAAAPTLLLYSGLNPLHSNHGRPLLQYMEPVFTLQKGQASFRTSYSMLHGCSNTVSEERVVEGNRQVGPFKLEVVWDHSDDLVQLL